MKYNNVYEEAVSLEGVVIITDVPVGDAGYSHPSLFFYISANNAHCGSHVGMLKSVTVRRTGAEIFILHCGTDSLFINEIMALPTPHTRYTILKYYDNSPPSPVRCPHCGGEATVEPKGPPHPGMCPGYRVVCTRCGITTTGKCSRAEAVATWNGDKQ